MPAPAHGDRHDAIVVGGGHNGLTAAAYLARAGLDVCLLESRDVLGGACVTEELWPGYRVSRASYVVSMLAPKVVAELGLRGFGYEPIPLEPPYATIASGTPLFFHDDPTRARTSIARRSRRDAEAYPAFAELLDRGAAFVRPLLLRPPPPLGARGPGELAGLVRVAARAARLPRRRRHELVRLMTMSVGDVLDEWFEDDALKGCLASTGVVCCRCWPGAIPASSGSSPVTGRPPAPSSGPGPGPRGRARCSCRAADCSSAARWPDALRPADPRPRHRRAAARAGPSTSSQSTRSRSDMTRKIAVATAVAALAVPAAAEAHVTLQPSSAPAGAFTVLNVRVPNERDDKSTARVAVQFPAGFAAARYEPKPGWRLRVVMGRLATPIQTDDGPITEGVRRMVWTRTSSAGGIKPGQFVDFPISVQIPGKAGDQLTFKALQTYAGGEVVRWIGAADSDQPAPRVSVTAAQADPAAHGAQRVGAARRGRLELRRERLRRLGRPQHRRARGRRPGAGAGRRGARGHPPAERWRPALAGHGVSGRSRRDGGTPCRTDRSAGRCWASPWPVAWAPSRRPRMRPSSGPSRSRAPRSRPCAR